MKHRSTSVLALLAAAGMSMAVPGATPLAHAGEPRPSATSPSPLSGLPWMGVGMDRGSDLGVRVEQVVRGSPAERAGLKVGDRIVAVDGGRVTAPAQVTRAVSGHKIGESVSLGVERTGNAFNAAVVLASRPSSDDLVRMHLVGAPAPAWTNITPLTGAPASVTALKGRVAILDFWASWCGPCRAIAPKLGQLKDRFGAQGLTVIGITTDEAELAATFAERHQMRYPSVVDKDGDTSRAYNIIGLPTMVVLDKKGVVREVFVGFDPGDTRLELAIKKLLAEPDGSAAPSGPVVPAPSVPRPEGR